MATPTSYADQELEREYMPEEELHFKIEYLSLTIRRLAIASALSFFAIFTLQILVTQSNDLIKSSLLMLGGLAACTTGAWIGLLTKLKSLKDVQHHFRSLQKDLRLLAEEAKILERQSQDPDSQMKSLSGKPE